MYKYWRLLLVIHSSSSSSSSSSSINQSSLCLLSHLIFLPSLSIMLNKLFAVSAVAASLQGVSAFTRTTGQIANRIGQSWVAGDACHPHGTWTIPSSDTIPPCLSEQLIAWQCHELYLGINQTSYTNCMSKGSWLQDGNGCIDCKHQQGVFDAPRANWWKGLQREALELMKKAPLIGSTWDLIQILMRQTPAPPEPASRPEYKKTLNVEDYYQNKPSVQGIGQVDDQTKTNPEVPIPRTQVRKRGEAAAAVDDGSYEDTVKVKCEDGSTVLFKEKLSAGGNIINIGPLA
ncbi:hypothetical protein L249_8641 [Ophiocordyceps polyrhachis-furcata BCC 54312]|uniref:Uncharacterized protein n=1 Tax=Ophiocordyceps polyrhachis-furcata BCC 54312 TaxID=1330021 RepID=A0A367L6W9_9HYPO|nr:hypothetical protein L249_8641 [Ophiocordyceps polyrhachis-furcata BCC 54312]